MNRNISPMKQPMKQPVKWQCVGESVRGASHLRTSLPNQDAIKLYQQSGRGLPAILAVSDGHGSAKSFRSHRGSSIAVEITVKVIKEIFLSSSFGRRDFSALEDTFSRLLSQRIADEWKKTVNRDLDLPKDYLPNQKSLMCRPNFTEEEYQTLLKKEGVTAWQSIESNHFLAYGATLLAVLVTEQFIVYLQLGDGDILQVDTKGNTTRPLAQDSRLIANQTTSLCMDNAADEFQVCVERYPESTQKQMPALILVSTDGYANSFSTDEGFSKIGQDYRQMFKETFIEDIRQQLKGVLQETSERGSGDDITLGMIKRLEKDDQDAWKPLNWRTMVPDKNGGTDMRRQENTSGFERKERQLAIAGKSDHAERIIIVGLAITLPLIFAYVGFTIHPFLCLNKVKSALSFLHFL